MKRKHKKHSKKRHSRRHSIGAIDFTNVLGVVAGAVAAGALNKVIPDTIDPKISAAGKLALGVFLPNFVKGGKMKNVLAGVGSGMVAVGSVELLKEFGVLSGTTGTDEVLEVSMNGDQDILAGSTSVLAGDDDMISGDDLSVVNGDDLSVVNGDDDYDFN